MTRGRSKKFILTIWTCPKCGHKYSRYRHPESFGKTLVTYCGPCHKVRKVKLEFAHCKEPGVEEKLRQQMADAEDACGSGPSVGGLACDAGLSVSAFGKVSIRDRERSAALLDCSAHISSIEFYEFSTNLPECSNKPPELRCCISGLHPMTKGQVQALATQLNAAINPIKESFSFAMMDEARKLLAGLVCETERNDASP